LFELFRFNRFFKKYTASIVAGVFYLTVSNAFLVWIPVLIRQTMDGIESNSGPDLAWMALALTFASVGYGLLLFLTRQTIIVSSRHIEYDLRNEVYAKMQQLPQSWVGTTSTGDIYIRLSEDIARVREYFGPAFMYAVNTITRSGIIITIMFLVNAELTWWALAPLPLLAILAYWMSRYIHDRSTEIQEQYAKLASRAQEAFSSIRLIKAYVREEYELERFADVSETYRRKKLRLDFVESLFHPMLNLLIGSSIVLVVWKGGELVISGVLSVGNIAEYIIYVTYLTWPIASLGYTLNLLQRAAASQKRIQAMLDVDVPVTQDADASHSGVIRGDIEFRNVSFRYPGSDVEALNNVSFTVRAGEHVAFVGRTGSGKTTLLNLIPRLWEPTSGQILMDGIPISELPVERLRASIGVVSQDGFLFSDTIEENIRFGQVDATDADVEIAAGRAQILENILDFEKKFKTILGERGVTLSGGQKQRTTIARAILRKPKVLLLDDALSAVDTKTEDAIIRQIQSKNEHRTIFNISHRISSIKRADRIYVLQDGTIAEEGTHNDLLLSDGPYSSMYQKQLIEQELENLN
jgi:ATP-binding cassette subfamily B multidrug efflux pump